MTVLRMNDPAAPKVDHEEYIKSIPLWVKIMEEPLFKIYQAGLKDGYPRTKQSKKRKTKKD